MSPKPVVTQPPLRVHAPHALAYCERLFYLEEVEELRVADAAVFAGPAAARVRRAPSGHVRGA